jgi:hypothetical protein
MTFKSVQELSETFETDSLFSVQVLEC